MISQRHGIFEAEGLKVFLCKSVFDLILRKDEYVPLNDAFKSTVSVCVSVVCNQLVTLLST